jgi:hypothetical protein
MIAGYFWFASYLGVAMAFFMVKCMWGSKIPKPSKCYMQHVKREIFVGALAKQKYMDLKKEMRLKCHICMDEYKDNDPVSIVACPKKHYFHTNCINKWLEHNNHCPKCKTCCRPNIIA